MTAPLRLVKYYPGTFLLKYSLNNPSIVKKANARMELLRRVAGFGAPVEDLKISTFFLLEVF